MITFKELYDGLLSGSISIDENGHDPFYGWGPESMLEDMKSKIDFWDKEILSTGRIWSNRIITDKSRDTDRHIRQIDSHNNCSRCGLHLGWEYNHEEKKIVCIVSKLNTSKGGVAEWFYEYEDGRCGYEKNTPQEFIFDMRESVIFANYFRDQMEKLDKEEEKRKHTEFSLNTLAGRKSVCEFHAKDNIGFQQMCNTSIDIYMSEDKKEILVIKESYVYDENELTEYNAELILPELGYTHCGKISLSVWRYMFANLSSVKKLGKDDADDSIVISPVLGKYLVSNYFGTTEHDSHKVDKFPIASRIKLIE